MDSSEQQFNVIENDESNDLAILMHQYGEMTKSRESIMDMEDCVETSCNLREKKGPNKRNRGVDQEELWTTVGRKGKLFARATDIDDLTRIPEDSIEVSLTCTEKLPKQFGLAKTLKEQRIQDVIRIKYLNSFKVLIQFSKEESADKLINCKKFNENGFKCQKTFEVNQTYGVIKNIDLDLTEEEIFDSLGCETLIIGVKRLKRRNTFDGRWEVSECVRVCFKGSYLPAHVFIFEARVSIDPYIYPVTQCSYCWRYGHSLRMCPSNKAVCPKCGNNHSNCDKTEFTCNNCGGKHMALAKICPVFIKEKRIRELMSEYNCSYKRALVIYTPAKPAPIEPGSPVISRPKENLREKPPLPESNSTAVSYAEVVKETEGKADKAKKKSKQKNRKENVNTIISEELDIAPEARKNGSKSQEEPTTEERTRRKEVVSWKVLLNKLKEKVLENNISWEEKISSCMRIVLEGIVSFVVYYLSDWSCFNFLNKYG